MSDLSEITRQLGEAYRKWKEGEREKAKLKDEFFGHISEQMEDGELAERLFIIRDATSQDDAFDYAEKYNPGWDVSAIRASDHDGTYEAILIENPEYKGFQYVNPDDKMVYTKSIVAGSIQLDDERLKECEPELYEQITYVPEPERRLRPLDDLEPSILAKLQQYMFQGPPIVKFPAPRKAKAEELDG